MSICNLVMSLRDKALVEGAGSTATLLNAAADALEELDERLSIIGENLDAVEAEFDELLQQIGVREHDEP